MVNKIGIPRRVKIRSDIEGEDEGFHWFLE